VYNMEPSISIRSFRQSVVNSLAVTCVNESDSLFLNVLKSKDLFLCIFSYLSMSELANVSIVCKYFKYLASRDYLWKVFYKRNVLSSLSEQ
jgi:hypothetical protein